MTNKEILKNINNYTFQYALNEIGTGFVQFFQMDFESILQGNKPKIDLEINELLTCYKTQIDEVANGIINLNKEYNNQEIKKIYDNQYFRNLMLQLQKQAGTRYVFDLQKYKKELNACSPLVSFFNSEFELLNILINKYPNLCVSFLKSNSFSFLLSSKYWLAISNLTDTFSSKKYASSRSIKIGLKSAVIKILFSDISLMTRPTD